MGIFKAYCPEFSGLNLIPAFAVYEMSQPREARITITRSISKIKYRYPGENWQEIKGDDFTLNQTCYGTYDVTVSYTMRICYFHRIRSQNTVTKRITGTILGLRLERFPNATALYIAYKDRSGQEQRSVVWSTSSKLSEEECYTTNPSVRGKADYISKPASDYQINNINLIGEEECNCIFNVLKCDKSVYTEERKECPQVEIDNCILNYHTSETIDIQLAPFEVLYVASGVTNILDIFNILNVLNSVLNVIPYPNSFNDYLQSLLGGNEEECIIIFTHIPGSPINIIKQICSSCNCPPPQYLVECDPVEQCPYNTNCQIECDDYICCYDKEGYVLKTIYK